MTRWLITQNGRRIGQASSWHKAVDVLRKQVNLRSFVVDVLGHDCFGITVIGGSTYLIRLEHID